MPNFAEFYALYPRKVARHAASLVWQRMSEEEREVALARLPQHIDYWKASSTEQQFIPHCRTWLSQKRWEDEIEMPAPAKPRIEAGWWATDGGTERMGASLGLAARPGETMGQFRDRIRNHLEARENAA